MLPRFSVKKPLTVVVGIIMILIIGVVAYISLGVDLLPDMELPYMIVVTIYAGAEPDVVDTEITAPLEASFATVSNVKRMNSTSNEHYSMIILELESGADTSAVKSNLNDAIALTSLPESDMLNDPMIIEIDPSMLPIMSLSVSYDGESNEEINAFLEQAISKINSVNGVASVSTSGLVSKYAFLNSNVTNTAKNLITSLEEKFEIGLSLSIEQKESLRIELKNVLDNAENNNELKTNDVLDSEKILDYWIRQIENSSNNSSNSEEEDTAISNFVNDYLISEFKKDGVARNAAIAFIENAINNSYIVEEGNENKKIFYNLIDELTYSSLIDFVEQYMSSMLTVLTEDIYKQVIFAQDFNMPAGSINEGASSVVVKVGDNVNNREEFISMPVFTVDLGEQLKSYVERVEFILNIISATLEDGSLTITDSQLLSLAENIAYQAELVEDYAEWVVNAMTSDNTISAYYMSEEAKGKWINLLNSEYLDVNNIERNPFFDLTASWSSENQPFEWRSELLKCIRDNQLYLPENTIISETTYWNDEYTNYYYDRIINLRNSAIDGKPSENDFSAYANYVIEQVTFLNNENRTLWNSFLMENDTFIQGIDLIENNENADWKISTLSLVLEQELYPDNWSNSTKLSVNTNLELAKNNLLIGKPVDVNGYANLAVYNVAILTSTSNYYLSPSARNTWVEKISHDTGFIDLVSTIGENDNYMYMVYNYLYKDFNHYVSAENKEGISTLLPLGTKILDERLWSDNEKSNYTAFINSEILRYQGIEETQNEFIDRIGRDNYDNFLAFFANRSVEENYNLLLDIIDVIGEIGGEGTITEDIDETNNEKSYTIDIDKIKASLSNSSDNLKITLTLGSLCDVTFVDDLSKQVTKLILGISDNNTTINSSIQLSIDKEPSASSAEVTEGIEKALEELKLNDNKFNYTILSNDGQIINFMLNSVFSSLILGGLLAIIILIFFLKDIKATLVIGASIIISVLSAIILMYFTDVSLNVISLGGLTLGVGMLVDNSIVVLENTYRIRAKGYTIMQSAVQGARQMLPAIFASTLTTIVVFLPVLFIEGLVKEIFLDFALTICYSLGASLLVSMTLVPMAYNSFMNPFDFEKKPKIFKRLQENRLYRALNSQGVLKEGKITIGIKKAYIKVLNWCLNYKFVPIALVIIVFGVSVFGAFSMSTEYFPNSYMGYISVNVSINTKEIDNKNAGVDYLDEHYYTYEQAEQDVVDILIEVFKGFKDINAVGISRATGMNVAGINLGSGNINATLTLVDEKERSKTAQQLVDELESEINDKANGLFNSSVSMYSLSSLISMTSGEMSVNLYGDNYSLMQEESKILANLYKNIDGVIDVDNGIDVTDKEYRVIIDKEKANQYGLTVAQVYLEISEALTSPSSLHNLKLSGKTIQENENLNVYLYNDEYTSKYWYLGKDNYGNSQKVYFLNNDSKNAQGNYGKYYISNNFGESVYVKYNSGNKEIIELVEENGLIPANRIENKVLYNVATITEQLDGTHMVNYTEYQVDIDTDKTYYSTLKSDLDLINLSVSTTNMLDTNAPVVQVPLYKLLSDDCLLKDNNGNVMYRAGIEENVPVGLEMVDGYSSISRKERQKVIGLTIYYDESISANDIQERIENVTEQYNNFKPAGIIVSTVSEGGIMDGVFEDLFMVLGVAIVLVFLVMVAQFQSWKSPIIILGTIILAFTGSFLLMWVTGTKIGIMPLIGLIILMGVVVNNGIVFVDYANGLIEKGYSKREAMLKTASDRIRPIIMTAITTILGMLGMALDGSDYGSLLQPLAIASIGGLIYATLMTLFIVPVLYELINRKISKRANRALLFRNTDFEFKEDGLERDKNEMDLFINNIVSTYKVVKIVSTDTDIASQDGKINKISTRKLQGIIRCKNSGLLRIYPLNCGQLILKGKKILNVYSYLIETEEKLILVNSGLSPIVRVNRREIRKIAKKVIDAKLEIGNSINDHLRRLGYKSEDIDLVVLTSAENYNVGGLEVLKGAKKIIYNGKCDKLLNKYRELKICKLDSELSLGNNKTLSIVSNKKNNSNKFDVIIRTECKEIMFSETIGDNNEDANQKEIYYNLNKDLQVKLLEL